MLNKSALLQIITFPFSSFVCYLLHFHDVCITYVCYQKVSKLLLFSWRLHLRIFNFYFPTTILATIILSTIFFSFRSQISIRDGPSFSLNVLLRNAKFVAPYSFQFNVASATSELERNRQRPRRSRAKEIRLEFEMEFNSIFTFSHPWLCSCRLSFVSC